MRTLGAQMGAPPPPSLYLPPALGGPSPVSFTSLNHAMSTFVDVDVIMVACHRAAVDVSHHGDAFLAGLGNIPVQGRCCRNFYLNTLCTPLTSSI